MLRPLQRAGYRVLTHHAAIASSKKYITGSRFGSTVAQLLGSSAKSQTASQDGLVTLNGFVQTVRKQKRVAFAAIGDGTSLDVVQAVLTPEQAKEYAQFMDLFLGLLRIN
jgi:hypothetical protein